MSLGEPWFRPKDMGYGFTPANAKGWATTIVFVLAAIATMLLLAAPGASRPPEAAAWLVRVRAGLGLSGLNLPLMSRLAVLGAEVVLFTAFAQWQSRPRA